MLTLFLCGGLRSVYGKVFESIYEGTLYGHWQAIVTMQQFIVLADSEGVVDMTPPAIAARTSIPLKIITEGIKFLEQPDPYSRTPGDEGRRIVLLDPENRPWGWRLVNHWKYRGLRDLAQKREADRQRVEKKRKENKGVAIGRHHVADVAHTEAEAEANTEERKPQGRAFALPGWVPQKPWNAWLKTRKKRTNTPEALEASVRKLERFMAEGMSPQEVIEQSLANGWQGLFPLKTNGSAPVNLDRLQAELEAEERSRAKH